MYKAKEKHGTLSQYLSYICVFVYNHEKSPVVSILPLQTDGPAPALQHGMLMVQGVV